jgi:hypothetical protein
MTKREDAMTAKQFEEYLKHLTEQVKADDKESPAFDKGYAFGKLMGRLLRDFSDNESSEFNEGLALGSHIELSKERQIH